MQRGRRPWSRRSCKRNRSRSTARSSGREFSLPRGSSSPRGRRSRLFWSARRRLRPSMPRRFATCSDRRRAPWGWRRRRRTLTRKRRPPPRPLFSLRHGATSSSRCTFCACRRKKRTAHTSPTESFFAMCSRSSTAPCRSGARSASATSRPICAAMSSCALPRRFSRSMMRSASRSSATRTAPRMRRAAASCSSLTPGGTSRRSRRRRRRGASTRTAWTSSWISPDIRAARRFPSWPTVPRPCR